MKTYKSYLLRTLEDIKNIPDDRLEACLVNLVAAIRRAKKNKTEIWAINWIDDGKLTATDA